MIEPPAEQMQMIEAELLRTLKDLQKATALDQRRDLSEIAKNLATAQGVYLNLVASLASMVSDDDFDWDDEDFDDDFDDDDNDPIDFPSRPHD